MQHCATSSSLTTLHIRHDSPSHSQTSSITVSQHDGVDIGSVARALNLSPNSVRLNGFHVSSTEPCHVSRGLAWNQLIEFFGQRGLPRGGFGDEIVVQGKYLGDIDSNNHCLKRKMEVEFKSSVKKTKRGSSVEGKCGKDVINGGSSENKSVNVKKRLNSEDGLEFFLKKIKIVESDTGTQECCTGTHLASFVTLNEIGQRKLIGS